VGEDFAESAERAGVMYPALLERIVSLAWPGSRSACGDKGRFRRLRTAARPRRENRRRNRRRPPGGSPA